MLRESLTFVVLTFVTLGSATLLGCVPANMPNPGPDKQFEGMVTGAAIGAGTGAVTGAQIASTTGPGALIGAGFGAVFGALNGLGIDLLEEDQIRRDNESRRLREIAWAQEVIREHYQRRLALHPDRDIFPADLFFEADESELRADGRVLVRELARLTKSRMPWSRIVVTAYVTTPDKESAYAKFLTSRRAEAIAREFVHCGIEPRRVQTSSMAIPEPLLLDPYDSPNRYRQAIELVPVDY